VRRAQELLKLGAVNLVDVAAACGFSSQAHLTSAFQGRLGVTPGRYRRSFGVSSR
jgi:AraC family transcriptional regulator